MGKNTCRRAEFILLGMLMFIVFLLTRFPSGNCFPWTRTKGQCGHLTNSKFIPCFCYSPFMINVEKLKMLDCKFCIVRMLYSCMNLLT